MTVRQIIVFLSLGLTALLGGCVRVPHFTKEEIKWFNPYDKTDTIIFISSKKELDTIIFAKKVEVSDSIRELLGRGYYNVNYLTVDYKTTEGSFHKFALMGDGKTRYPQSLFSLSKRSSGDGSFEITFIGTIFNGKELENINQTDKNTFYFDSSKATYQGMDVEKGIKNFTFDIRTGITKYTDDRGVDWIRK